MPRHFWAPADWFDPVEAGVRQRIRVFIEEMLEAELEAALQRHRYERAMAAAADGTTREWRNRTLPTYKRLTRQAEALIAGTYLAGTEPHRVRRRPFGLDQPAKKCTLAWV